MINKQDIVANKIYKYNKQRRKEMPKDKLNENNIANYVNAKDIEDIKNYIQIVADSFQKISDMGITLKLLILMINNITGIGKRDILNVLKCCKNLKKHYLT